MDNESKKILVVDDEQDSIDFVTAVIEDLGGYQVMSAVNGEEAVELTRREMPALVIMDVNMPKKDGYTAFTELQEDPRTSAIPVIMLSSLTDFGEYVTMNPDVKRPRLFLDKPIAPERLAEMIGTVVTA